MWAHDWWNRNFEVLLESWNCRNVWQPLWETVLSGRTSYSKRTATEAGDGMRNNVVDQQQTLWHVQRIPNNVSPSKRVDIGWEAVHPLVIRWLPAVEMYPQQTANDLFYCCHAHQSDRHRTTHETQVHLKSTAVLYHSLIKYYLKPATILSDSCAKETIFFHTKRCSLTVMHSSYQSVISSKKTQQLTTDMPNRDGTDCTKFY